MSLLMFMKSYPVKNIQPENPAGFPLGIQLDPGGFWWILS